MRFANSDGKLLPGMTANVRVVTDQRENVLRVPNAALRMRIEGVEPAAPPVSAAAVSSSPTASAPAGAASGPEARRKGPPNRSRVYVLGADGKPVAYAVRAGVSDGSTTELLLWPNSPAATALVEGTEVVIGTQSSAVPSGARPGGPRAPF